MKNAGPLYEWEGAGLTSVNISGTGNGTLSLSAYSWEYKVPDHPFCYLDYIELKLSAQFYQIIIIIQKQLVFAGIKIVDICLCILADWVGRRTLQYL